jgi:hypothetical protein
MLVWTLMAPGEPSPSAPVHETERELTMPIIDVATKPAAPRPTSEERREVGPAGRAPDRGAHPIKEGNE